ncbi:acyl-CoA carboxylase epsilon subunit [Streptomyces blastmyceticus]|uniref:Acyl-CoA carboxylase subunit epsilon n=1 Tax=Streptomyces blastmyceticus TaxID=68180 RepID=A0ABN0X2A9_9ACTN
MSGGESVLRVVRGNPDAAELAAVVTVVLAAGAGRAGPAAGPPRPVTPWARPAGAAVGWSARPAPAWRPAL